MPRAKLAVDVPESLWIARVSNAHPDVTFRVLSALPGPDAVTAVIEVPVANPVPLLVEAADGTEVRNVDLLWKRAETALVEVEAATPPVLAPIQGAGVPVETPFSVEDGVVTWEVTASADRLSRLGEALAASDVDYRIEYVHTTDADPGRQLLTDRQREVFEAAVDAGYYDVPRGATLTAVADRLDVSKSTCSDVLHRAESAIAHWFADRHGETGTVDERQMVDRSTDDRPH